jgi:cold shock protein
VTRPAVIRDCTSTHTCGTPLLAYRRSVAHGVVKFWNAEKGWGAISSDELPPGRDAWAHFSQIMDMPGYRALEAGQAVEFSFEAAQQDSFEFRVIEVRLTASERS